MLPELVARELDQAERDAWKNLARYKFWMFGYFAARWVYLNRIAGAKRPNPFKRLVLLAREVQPLPLTAAQQYANREKHGHFGSGHS